MLTSNPVFLGGTPTNPSAYGRVGSDNLNVSAVHGPDDFIYGVMSVFSWPKAIGRFAKVGFEDRFDDEFYRHLNHSVAEGRNPQGTLTAFAFGYHDPLDRRWFIRLAFECFFQLRQISGFPFFGFDGGKGNAVYPGTAFVGAYKIIGVTEDVFPIDLVIQSVKTEGWFLLGLALELPL